MTETYASRTEFVGVDFDQLDEAAAVDVCVRLARQPRFSYVATPNVDHIVRLHASVPLNGAGGV